MMKTDNRFCVFLIFSLLAALLCVTAAVSADLIWPIPGFEEETAVPTATAPYEINYMVLVNKENPLPETREEVLHIDHMTNSLGDDVEVEAKAYEAYLALKTDLAEDGVIVDLDSAYRSVAEQQRIAEDFTERYGEEYVKQYVAVDLYLNICGEDVYMNEDMVQYPEIWAKTHARLASHGFILRYLEGKEDITGYSYEPWHIRYIDDPVIAQEIMDQGLVLEEYLQK